MRLAQTCWSVEPLGGNEIKRLYGVRLWLRALDCGQCSCDSGMFAVQPSRKLILSQRLCVVEYATLVEAALFLREGAAFGERLLMQRRVLLSMLHNVSDTGAARGCRLHRPSLVLGTLLCTAALPKPSLSNKHSVPGPCPAPPPMLTCSSLISQASRRVLHTFATARDSVCAATAPLRTVVRKPGAGLASSVLNCINQALPPSSPSCASACPGNPVLKLPDASK